MITVSILCASSNSVYHDLEGVIVYDRTKDARTFPGNTPIVAHPPCRAWSAFLRHQAKPESGEKDLGMWCVEQLRKCGGVLEQPAHSHLWTHAGLPIPGTRITASDVWAMEVWQAWWGYPTRKATWLAFAGVPRTLDVPYRLHAAGRDRRRMQLMSHNQRSATTPEFSRWLVAAARMVHSKELAEWNS